MSHGLTCLFVCSKAGEPVTDGKRYIEMGKFAGENFRDDGLDRQADVSKHDHCSCTVNGLHVDSNPVPDSKMQGDQLVSCEVL